MKTTLILSILGAIAFLSSLQQSKSSDTIISKKGMVKVTILYPNAEGKTFDMDYYANKHMPMLAELFGESLKGLEIDKGVAGRTPEEPVF